VADFKYTPDDEIPIHREGAIKQLCRPFLSHENGLPEWVKNSAAAYLRDGRGPGERVVVVLFCHGRGARPATIACLDLVGMTSLQIERDFRRWADPEAATRSSDTKVRLGELGGHGNGGKCYMTQMFEDHCLLYTVRSGRGCRYGVAGGHVAFGYVPDARTGRDFTVDDVASEINICLGTAGATLSDLPQAAAEAVRRASGFSFICGFRPRDYGSRIPVQSLVESLLSHPQMVSPLQLCSIYVLANGQAYNAGHPLSLPVIEPMHGYEEPRVIVIPGSLKDPMSGQAVPITAENGGTQGKLEIRTSEKNMRVGRGGKRKWRHTVTFHTLESGVIGSIPMTSLVVDSSFRDFMYCDCYLESLDRYQRNERGALAESPLTRAVQDWISGQVRAYCREFEVREQRRLRDQDRDELSRINEWLDQWKNQFMQEFMHGLYGQGEGAAQRERASLPSGTPASMELGGVYPRAGLGVYFRPSLRFFDKDRRRIRPVPYRWVSEDNNVAMVDEDLNLIQTFAFGKTGIFAQTLDGQLCSNQIALEVVRIIDIRIVPRELVVPAGTRNKLQAMCRLPDGTEIPNVHLTWMEANSAVARVSSRGMVYGFAPGETEVTALDESCRSDAPARITITPSDGRGAGNQRGRGFPRILISEIDCLPGEASPPQFRKDEPPICQRVQDTDANVWWINLASPFARLYSDQEGGYGVKSEAWRMYHVERLIDVIIQIALTHGPDSDQSLDSNDWALRAAEIEAEIRGKAIESLVHFITSGETED